MYTSRQDPPMLSISGFCPLLDIAQHAGWFWLSFPLRNLQCNPSVSCAKKRVHLSRKEQCICLSVYCVSVCVCVYVVFVRVCLCGCTIVCLEAEPPNQFIQESIRIKGEAVSLYGERSTPISTSQKWLRWRASAGAQARKMNSKSIFCDMSSLV